MANAKIKTDQIPSMDPKETQRVGKKVTSQTATNISTNLISKPSKAPTLVATPLPPLNLRNTENSVRLWALKTVAIAGEASALRNSEMPSMTV